MHKLAAGTTGLHYQHSIHSLGEVESNVSPLLFLALVTVLYELATSQSGCTSTLMNLSPCLKYVLGNTSVPSSSCCTRLATVVQSQPQCLCTFVNGGGSSLGLNINQTRAVRLPGACSVSTPAASKCNIQLCGSSPAPAANSSVSPPADSSDDTPSTSTTYTPVDDTPSTSTTGTPVGSGSKTVPTSVGTSDARRSTRIRLHVGLFLAFIGSYAVGF